MNETETDTNQKTVRIKEQTYNRLSDLGTVKETFNDVIGRLISFYEAHNTGLHSSSIQVLKESVDFPVKEEYKQIALQLFEGILSLGDDVSFTLRMDLEEKPLIENRKNNVIFYKDNTALCLVRTGRGMVWLYLPTEDENAKFPGWKDEWNILVESALKQEMGVIKRLYEDM
jgi:predicted CopG family antitoxin